MTLQTIDWIIVLASVLVCFLPALAFGKRSGKDTAEFFASGRSVPWWLAGTSMVAGNGTIVFAGNGGDYWYGSYQDGLVLAANASLTIAAGITVHGHKGRTSPRRKK